MRDNNAVEENNRTVIIAQQRKHFDACVKSISNLVSLYVSPDNADRSLLTDSEYKEQKNALTGEKSRIEQEIRSTEQGINDWLELTEQTFHFATYAKHWFDNGDFQKKTQILAALGKNFTLLDGKLSIELQKPFLVLKQGLESMAADN